MTDLDLDPTAIEAMILQLGAIGAHSGTGVWRTVYSPEWVAATELIAAWAKAAGLTVRRDAVGNLWARTPGDYSAKAIVSGSHIDSQCPGGRYDGALGVISALVAITALIRKYGPPIRPLELLCLCEEEGSRFPSAGFWGSRAITGRIKTGDADNVRDADGAPISSAMQSVGLDPALIASAQRSDIAAFLELHIEQGPILEQAALPVAVVNAITGIRHTKVTLTGQANHAGAFPMDLRRDPMAGFAEVATTLINHAHRLGRPAVTTIGRCIPHPNAGAIIPGSVTFTLDARHPDPAAFAQLHSTHLAVMTEVAARRGLGLSLEIQFDLPPTLSDPTLVKLLQTAAGDIPHITMASGAGHDSQQMAAICPVAMVFVRSEGGRSHTPEEFSTLPDCVAGIRVLAGALHALAYGDPLPLFS
jgi:allantoate deiminase